MFLINTLQTDTAAILTYEITIIIMDMHIRARPTTSMCVCHVVKRNYCYDVLFKSI